jgi:hypothetical protein
MKKLIIASFVAALFAACNNTPAVNESAAKVATLTSWVDSIKNVISAAPTHDSATWAGYNNTFNEVVASIKMEDLNEAEKTQLTAATTSWNEVGTMYTTKMNEEKAAMVPDTTKAPAAPEMKEGEKAPEMKK